MLRYAIERFPEMRRRKYLDGTVHKSGNRRVESQSGESDRACQNTREGE
jgi:hypothetical protein